MNSMELNEILKKALWQECSLVGNFDRSYSIEFPSKASVDQFMEFADDCKVFLSQYGIETGALVVITSEESNKFFTIQINKLPTIVTFTETLGTLNKATQLHEAVSNGELENVKKLLDDGVDVNKKNIVGETSVHIAARMGHAGIIEVLLEKGALINIANNEYETPLHIVAQTNHVSILEKFLANTGIIVHSKKDKEGNTALHLAARVGNLDVMGKLLQSGIDIESTNNEGETPLLLAAYATHTSAVEFLLKQGANINHQDNDAATALHIAVNGKAGLPMVKILLANGADVTIKNNRHATVLDIADRENDAQMGQALIDALLEQAPVIQKPIFIMQALSEYWDEQSKKLADKAGQVVVEGATGGAKQVLGFQKIQNLIRFFSSMVGLQPNSADADERESKEQTTVNLAK